VCNHYRNHEQAIADWREYVSWNLPPWQPDEFSEIKIDIWPRRPGLVIRIEDRAGRIEAMTWMTWR
jgi:hypothetical protein